MIDTSALQGMTAKYATLGCKLNFSETATFAHALEEMGVRTAKDNEKADICLINTCSVTEVADHKCRQQIHKMVRENPGTLMVVTGCYAQLRSKEIAQIPGVSLVLGSNEKANLIQSLTKEVQRKGMNGRCRSTTHKEATGILSRPRTSRPFSPLAPGATARVSSSRCKMAATISAPIAPYLMHAASHATLLSAHW